jgi:hypothetical protein
MSLNALATATSDPATCCALCRLSCRSCATRGRRRSHCCWALRPTRWKAASQVSRGHGQLGKWDGGASPLRWLPSAARVPTQQTHACAPYPLSAAAGAGHVPSRIDYVFSSGRATAAELALTDTGRGFSFSDHLGVLATLRFASTAGSGGGESSDGTGPGLAAGHSAACSMEGDGPLLPRQQLCSPRGETTLLTLPELMRRQPEPFQHAAAAVEAAAMGMARGRRRCMRLAFALWAAGFGCLGVLAARGCWPEAERMAAESQRTQLALLCGTATALGWAGGRFATPSVLLGVATPCAAEHLQLLRSPTVPADSQVWYLSRGLLHAARSCVRCSKRRVSCASLWAAQRRRPASSAPRATWPACARRRRRPTVTEAPD